MWSFCCVRLYCCFVSFFMSVCLLWSLCGFVLDVAVCFVVSVCLIVVILRSFCLVCVVLLFRVLLHVCLFYCNLCVGLCFMLPCALVCLSAWLWWLLCEVILWFCDFVGWLVVSVFKSVLISDCTRVRFVLCVIVFFCVVVYCYGWHCIQSAEMYTTSAYTLHYDKLVSPPHKVAALVLLLLSYIFLYSIGLMYFFCDFASRYWPVRRN